MPKVSVVIACYNSAATIVETLSSVLSQTFEDFEVVVVNDGSTDDTLNVVSKFTDERIRIYSFSENKGLPYARNKGNTLAKGKYIAVLDADDICQKQRLEKQVAFLDKHPEIGVLGSRYKSFGDQHQRVRKYPDDGRLKSYMAFGSPFGHSTVTYRKSLLLDHNVSYNNCVKYALDYDLFFEASKHTKFACLSDYLLLYRVHNKNVTSQHFTEQTSFARDINERVLSYYFDMDKSLYNKWYDRYHQKMNTLIDLFRSILDGCERKRILDKSTFNSVCFDNWIHIYKLNKNINNYVSKANYLKAFPGTYPYRLISIMRIIRFFLK